MSAPPQKPGWQKKSFPCRKGKYNVFPDSFFFDPDQTCILECPGDMVASMRSEAEMAIFKKTPQQIPGYQ
jgi:hypothetical protein